jgi:hypothetical protein
VGRARARTPLRKGVIDGLHGADIKVVGGYVATGYGCRSTGEVEDEVSGYYKWYDIDSIFLDQQSASTDQVGYYEELYEYVKDQSGSSSIVVTNAGAPVPQACIYRYRRDHHCL